jgi:hypothetical protein
LENKNIEEVLKMTKNRSDRRKSKERFVIDKDCLDQVMATIRNCACMRKETSEVYFADEIRIYKMEDDAWYVGVYGMVDRRKHGEER